MTAAAYQRPDCDQFSETLCARAQVIAKWSAQSDAKGSLTLGDAVFEREDSAVDSATCCSCAALTTKAVQP